MKNYSKKVRNHSPFASDHPGFRSQPRSWVDFGCYALFFLETQTEKKNHTSSIFVVLETLLEFIYRQLFQQTQRVLCMFEPANENCKRLSHE